MAGIVVSEYTGVRSGLGFLDPKVHATPEAAAKDILERQQRNAQTIESNKRYGSNIGTTSIEVHETSARPGSTASLNEVSSIKPSVLSQIKGHVAKGLAGLAMTGVVGVAAAMEPGASPASVGTAMVDQGIPGWASARQGQACKAFGDATGYVAAGLTVTAGATVTTGLAIGGGALTGPAAPATAAAIAAGGSYATVKAAEGAEKLGNAAGEAACEGVSKAVTKVKSTFGFGS